MRIIRFFSSTFIFLVFFIMAGIFFGREILIIMATSDLKRAVHTLNNTSHYVNCYDGFSRSPFAWGQLRFIDEKNYVLETVCSDFQKNPVLIESKTLPMFVKKVDGASGFVFNSKERNSSQITLNALGKEQQIYKEIDALAVGEPPALGDYVAGPASQCQAFNYQCCQNDIEQGVGRRQELAIDCPKTCFQSCRPRPLVVSFNAMPSDLGGNRTVSVRSGQAITFAFVVSDGKQELFSNQIMASDKQDDSFLGWKTHLQSLISLVGVINNEPAKEVQLPITNTIFFGDGQDFSTQNLQGVTDHVYTCSEAICNFEARIEAQDAFLTTSADHELSRLNIIVSN